MSSGSDPEDIPWIDRELSWLAFNARVLQEAADPTVPLFERFGFLAIFSSNLDEFFRVRVASLRSLLRLKKRKVKALGVRPARLLREIHRTVVDQQEEFGRIFRDVLLPSLEAEGIRLVRDPQRHPEILEALREEFESRIRPELEIRALPPETDPDRPFLEDRTIYLAVETWRDRGPRLVAEHPEYHLVRIPTPQLSRFVEVELAGGDHGVVFLDDVIRFHLPDVFPGCEIGSACAIKLSRDAELYLDDEYGVELVEAIRRSLDKRSTGVPSRFLYDGRAPHQLVATLQARLGLAEEDLVLGGRYHNLHDLRDLPRFGRDDLTYDPWPAHPHSDLDAAPSVLDAIRERDHLLHFPYHSFATVVRFLEEAAADPDVEEIFLTVYRVSSKSAVLNALLAAAAAGKRVSVFFEVQARFDERSNLEWARRLEAAGCGVSYSIPGLKVHAKVALVSRREDGELRDYAYLGTGNFNEVTSRFYTDLGLLTADPVLAPDVRRVFEHLDRRVEGDPPEYRRLLVAPHGLRPGIEKRIRAEIEAHRAGRPAYIEFKLNALEDAQMIALLTEASSAGVPIRGIVRGICCLAPGVSGQTETLHLTSIVDRYLEHTRVYRFHAGGRDEIWLASADWMERNLSRRVEVAFPVEDARLADQVRRLLDLQFRDGHKARRIDIDGTNAYASRDADDAVRSQAAHYDWIGSILPSDRGADERA